MYEIGQVFVGKYTPEAAVWCNRNNAYIEKTGPHGYTIKKKPEQPQRFKVESSIAELQSYLASTDWYAVRYAETDVGIPEEVRARRQSTREQIDALRLELAGLEKAGS